jgi:hypothetical protein
MESHSALDTKRGNEPCNTWNNQAETAKYEPITISEVVSADQISEQITGLLDRLISVSEENKKRR